MAHAEPKYRPDIYAIKITIGPHDVFIERTSGGGPLTFRIAVRQND